MGRAQGSDAPCRGIWAALHGKMGGSSGAIISGGPSLGAGGRRRPAEEVVRELPGAGSRETLGGSGSLSREIETAGLVVEVESSTQGNGGGGSQCLGRGWSCFLGLVCQCDLGRCQGSGPGLEGACGLCGEGTCLRSSFPCLGFPHLSP